MVESRDLTATDILEMAYKAPETEVANAIHKYWSNKLEIDIDKLTFLNSDLILKLLARCRNLKRFVFTEKRIGLKFSALSYAIRRCEKLEVLDIRGIKLSAFDLAALINHLKSLKSLAVNVVHCENELGELFKNNPSLLSVSILDSGDIFNGSCLKYLPKSITNLELLKGFNKMPIKCLIDCLGNWKLDILNLSCSTLMAGKLAALSGCNSLLSLHVNCGYMTPEDHQLMKKIILRNQNLTNLGIYVFGKTYGLEFQSYVEYLPGTMKNIELKGCYNSFRLTQFIIRRGIDLKSLYINNKVSAGPIPNVDNRFFDRIVQTAPNLEHLSFSTYESMPSLYPLRDLTQLSSLNLDAEEGTEEQFHNVLQEIGDNCRGLEKLVIENVQWRSYLHRLLNIIRLPKLIDLHLIKAKFVNEKFIHLLGLCDTSLQSLEIRDCPDFNDENAVTLILTRPTLNSLLISGCNTTEELVLKVNDALAHLTQRTTVLKLTLEEDAIYEEFSENTNLHHHLLQLRGLPDQFL